LRRTANGVIHGSQPNGMGSAYAQDASGFSVGEVLLHLAEIFIAESGA